MEFSTLCVKDRVYLDHNATAPLARKIAEQVPLWLENWGNPSSIHHSGRGPKAVLRETRRLLAQTIGADSALELIFTSGGSEANNLALKGVFEKLQRSDRATDSISVRRRVLVSSVEHPSVRRTAEYLERCGADVDIIPVRKSGEIDLEVYANLLDERVALVSVMLANNETGNLFPVKAMADLAHTKGALFHSDCVQALGKIHVNVRELGVDLASFSAHKFYALKGVGVLYVRRGVSLESLIHGGAQERHRRGGTENTLAIASLGEMCTFQEQIQSRGAELKRLRDHLEDRVLAEIPGVSVTGRESDRLPNTSSLIIEGVDGETLLMNLDMRGFSVSTGAACSSGSPEPSPVLLAMGLTRAEAQSSLRVGLGWANTQTEVDLFVDELDVIVKRIRSFERPVGAGTGAGMVAELRKPNV
jgi:cysteine desulfurase